MNGDIEPETRNKYPEYVRGLYNHTEIDLDRNSIGVSIIKGDQKFEKNGIEYEAIEYNYHIYISFDNDFVISIDLQNPQVTKEFYLVDYPGINANHINTIAIYNTSRRTSYISKRSNLKVNDHVQLNKNVLVGGYYYDMTLDSYFKSEKEEDEDIVIKDLNIRFYYSIDE